MVDPRTDVSPAADYELARAPGELPPPPPRRNAGVWVAVAVLVAAAAIAAYIVFGGRTAAPAADVPQAVNTPPERRIQPLGGAADPIELPPLGESDALIRSLVERLSSHPRVAAWLATGGLIRNFTVAVINTAEGKTPAVHLRVLRPSEPFAVVERAGGVYIDPRSYARYDGLAAAVASIDPAGAARVYATVKPRIEEAHRELGAPDGTLDRTLERAIVLLLKTPVVSESVRVQPQGIGYAFADPNLEGLTPAQKQLLRMGPANVRLVQSSLRAMALHLGIPAERLPPSSD